MECTHRCQANPSNRRDHSLLGIQTATLTNTNIQFQGKKVFYICYIRTGTQSSFLFLPFKKGQFTNKHLCGPNGALLSHFNGLRRGVWLIHHGRGPPPFILYQMRQSIKLANETLMKERRTNLAPYGPAQGSEAGRQELGSGIGCCRAFWEALNKNVLLSFRQMQTQTCRPVGTGWTMPHGAACMSQPGRQGVTD